MSAPTPKDSSRRHPWEKALTSLNHKEWEALCDGCGRCCVHKLEDEADGRLHFTNVACRLLDTRRCRCRDYSRRRLRVPGCISLSADNLPETAHWLPETCAYRLLQEGKPLPGWHPLRSGTPHSVREAGISVCGRVVDEAHADALELHIVDWIR